MQPDQPNQPQTTPPPPPAPVPQAPVPPQNPVPPQQPMTPQQPPQPGVPNPMPMAPQKKSRKGLKIALIVIGVLVLIVIVVIVLGVMSLNSKFAKADEKAAEIVEMLKEGSDDGVQNLIFDELLMIEEDTTDPGELAQLVNAGLVVGFVGSGFENDGAGELSEVLRAEGPSGEYIAIYDTSLSIGELDFYVTMALEEQDDEWVLIRFKLSDDQLSEDQKLSLREGDFGHEIVQGILEQLDALDSGL